MGGSIDADYIRMLEVQHELRFAEELSLLVVAHLRGVRAFLNRHLLPLECLRYAHLSEADLPELSLPQCLK